MRVNNIIKTQHIKLIKALLKVLLFIILFLFTFFLIKFGSIILNIQFDDDGTIKKDTVIALISSILSIFVTKIFKSKNFVSKTKFKLYTFLYNKYHISENVFLNIIIEHLIYVIYYGDYYDIDAQLNISNSLIKILNNQEKTEEHIYYISGKSHSGKTVSIKRFINDILTDKTQDHLFYKYSKRIYYYDLEIFVDDTDVITKLIRNKYYKAAIVIFDNLHVLEKQKLNDFVKTAFLYSVNTDLIILLTREIDYRLDLENIELIKNTNNKNYLFQDEITETLTLTEGVKYFSKIIPNFTDFRFDSFTRLHTNNVYKAYKKLHINEVPNLYKSLLNKDYYENIYHVWTFICCACCFTGYFKKQKLFKWCVENRKTEYKSLLRAFKRTAIISNFADTNRSYYYLHEKVARFYVNYICRTDLGRSLCKTIIKFLFESIENEYLKYIYSIAIDESKSNTFFQICQNVNYEIMYEDMSFIIKTFNIKNKDYLFELAVLSDRIGYYELTEKRIKAIYDKTNDQRCLIFLLHGNHWAYFDRKYHDAFEQMKSSDNAYIRFSTNYWIMHLYMHKGIWNIDEIVNLSNSINKNIKDISNQSYDGNHFLRRYYFDCLRFYYLEGSCNCIRLKKLLEQLTIIKSFLKDNLDEFEYYNNKFLYGHAIQYDMLYKKHVLEEPIYDYLKLLKIENSHKLVSLAYDYYQKAYNAMRMKNDKTADYVFLRMVEINPISYLNSLSNSNHLSDICEINEEDYLRIIEFYDNFGNNKGIKEGVYEYAAFAETYKIKFTLICQFLCANLNIDFRKTISNCIEKAREYHNLYNKDKPNLYGEIRLKIYEAISNYIFDKSKQGFDDRIAEYLDVCKKSNFQREEKLLQKLIAYNDRIEIEYLKNICLYYPIVLQ